MKSTIWLTGRYQTQATNRLNLFLFGVALNVNIFGSAVADNAPDIEAFSINELMQMEVSSASRKSQTVSDTAAAAFVISQEDIRRSGATSIPDALRLAPGLEVAQINASVWAVTARGFNSRYANKLLVLMEAAVFIRPYFPGCSGICRTP